VKAVIIINYCNQNEGITISHSRNYTRWMAIRLRTVMLTANIPVGPINRRLSNISLRNFWSMSFTGQNVSNQQYHSIEYN